ncbi:hypothetical protein [Streptomyces sp. ALI-76-A]|uniref:hypothetical protein n=1 Tax=Streptomyces sp. ALI-76-A TaxID=3025736 RepID=UPI00256E9ABF|nr:hypothetical protein [Streptomyces sp. ALI-76-A]MDL5206052.1 hypothetical protein [Streptomyces sp. ALI-76-A]
MAVTGRRGAWRWAVAVWLVLVAVAGGLTLWWQDSAEPQRHGWEESAPTPSLPEGWQSACAAATPDENGEVLCFFRTR